MKSEYEILVTFLVTILATNPAGQWGAGTPLNPNRSSVSIGKREMACSFSPDDHAIYATPTSPPIDLPSELA
jgi:hypothetical protein